MGETSSMWSKLAFWRDGEPEIAQTIDEKGRVFNGAQAVTPDSNLAYIPSWYEAHRLGQVRRGIDYIEIRKYEKSPWVQMVINTIVKQIMTTKWEIIPTDEEDDTDYSELIDKVTNFLECPNRNGDTFSDVFGAYTRDLLALDAAVMLKGKNRSGEIVELFAHDSSRFLVDSNEFGIIQGYYQYSIRFPKGAPKFFEPEDVVYGKMSNNTEYYPYGWSPLQSAQQVVDLMLQSTRHNKDFFKNNATPDSLVTLDMPKEDLDNFRNEWNRNLKGKAHKLAFLDAANVKVERLSMNNRDMEWLEGQKWYHHIIFAVYGLSPQEVGFYENSNRATGDSQERVSVKNAIKPYLAHITQKINREIIPEILGMEVDIPVKFKWFPKDHVAEKIEFEQAMKKLELGVYTINEVRALEGKEAVEWGDVPVQMLAQQSNPDNPNDPDNQDKPGDEVDEVEQPKKNGKPFIKATESFIVEEATDYADLLSKQFTKWEEKILQAVDEELDEEVPKESKALNDFIVRVFSTVNTTTFKRGVHFEIGKAMKDGLKDVEAKLGQDIGVSEDFRNRVEIIASQQINGYNINGKYWHGIKGVANELHHKILVQVGDDIRARESLTTIKENIREIMAKEKGGKVKGEVTEGRTMKIARTEITNSRNEGRLQAFADSGVKGRKVWDAIHDSKTSDICKRLDGQVREIWEPFRDPVTKKDFMRPVSHPNCRCQVKFKVEE